MLRNDMGKEGAEAIVGIAKDKPQITTLCGLKPKQTEAKAGETKQEEPKAEERKDSEAKAKEPKKPPVIASELVDATPSGH